MTEPDIVAHEVAHIYTEHMSDLEYHLQSGGISESFSDMAGTNFTERKNWAQQYQKLTHWGRD